MPNASQISVSCSVFLIIKQECKLEFAFDKLKLALLHNQQLQGIILVATRPHQVSYIGSDELAFPVPDFWQPSTH